MRSAREPNTCGFPHTEHVGKITGDRLAVWIVDDSGGRAFAVAGVVAHLELLGVLSMIFPFTTNFVFL